MGRVYIYVLQDPHHYAPRYVGMTIRPQIRMKEHIRESKLKNNNPKNDWIRKLRRNGVSPTMLLIEATCDHRAAEREIFWVNYFRNCGYKIMNYAEPGGKPPTLFGEQHPMWGKRLADFGIYRSGKNNPMWGKVGHWKNKQRTSDTNEKISKTLQSKESDYNVTALSKDDIFAVDKMLRDGILSGVEIARQFGVSKSVVSAIKHRSKKAFKFLENKDEAIYTGHDYSRSDREPS